MGDFTTLANLKQWLNVTGLQISAVTNASPAALTLAARPTTPLISGATYGIEGSIGMAGLDGSWPITVTSPQAFTIPFDSTLAGTYAGGATVGVNDALLSRLITAASVFMQNYMSNAITLASYVETRNGVGGNRMMTLRAPIVAVTGVSVDGVAVLPRPALGPGSSSYSGGWVNDDVSIMISGGGFCRGFQNVTFSYSAGYATTPPDLEQACIDLISDWFKYRDRIGKASESIEGQSISFTNQQIPPRALATMNLYNTRYPAQ